MAAIDPFFTSPPPEVPSHVWELELQQREIRRFKFPDTQGLWGPHVGQTTSFTPFLGRHAIPQTSPFTVPYQGKRAIGTPLHWQKPHEVGLQNEFWYRPVKK